MGNKWKRLLAVVLAVSVVASQLSVGVLASEGEEDTTPKTEQDQTYTNEKDTGIIDTTEGEEGTEPTEPTDGEEGETGEVAEPIVWDEETKTLTITGLETVTAADVSAYKAKAEKVVITDVGTIVKEAFADFKMTELEIKNVEHIEYSFRSCTKLETLTIDEVGTIDTFAFYNPASLQSVTISNVDTIGENVFNVYGGVTTLTSVTLENTDVGSRMFAEHKNLTDLTLTNVGTIGFQAFMNCSGLTELDLSGGVEALGTSAFLGCTGLTELDLDGIEVGTTAFYGCTGLESVTVKNTDIGKQAFVGCIGLKTVTLEDIGTIGDQVFGPYGALPACTALETITMKNVGTIGKNVLSGCTAVETIELDGVETIGEQAFISTTATAVTMNNVGTIGKNAFASSKVTTVEMSNIGTIDQFAFYNCTGLTSIDLNGVTNTINGFAFYGCSNLNDMAVKSLAAKLGYVGTSDEIMARVEAILAGKFQLEDPNAIVELKVEEGRNGAVGKSENWETYENGTQIREQAQWTSIDNGVAQVEVTAYYTAQKQMDYIFVADLSASMARLGNTDDQNARFYDMQSKLLDMTGKLLDTDGYDCRVAIVTFGGYVNTSTTGSVDAMQFTGNLTEAQDYIKALAPLNENTDYALGLNKVLELAQAHDSDRNTVVVFLSDGRPTYDGTTSLGTVAALKGNDEKVAGIAQQIKDAGVQGIYGVLHSPDQDGNLKYAKNAMGAVCDEYYTSTDTESFGNAMNAAFAAAYGDNTVTIPVNTDNFVASNLTASAGDVSYDNGVITWKLEGMPFTQHTLTYNMTLTAESAAMTSEQSFKLNKGDATFGEGKASVGLDIELTRTQYTVTYTDGVDGSVIFEDVTVRALKDSVTPSFGGTPTRTGYTFNGWSPAVAETVTADVTYTAQWSAISSGNDDDDDDDRPTPSNTPTPTPEPVATSEPTATPEPSESQEELPDQDVPMTELPDEEPPMAALPEEAGEFTETLEDGVVPLAQVPETGDNLAIWMLMAVSSLFGLGYLGRKKEI